MPIPNSKYRFIENACVTAALLFGSYVIGYCVSGIVHAALAQLRGALQ